MRPLQSEAQGQNIGADLVNTVPAAISHLKQCPNNRPACYKRGALIENYLEGHLRFHLHLIGGCKRLTIAHELPAHQFCIVIECPSLTDLFVHNYRGIDERRKLEIKALYGAAGQMERAVLVDVRELIEMPQWTDCVLPGRVRLKRFDQGCGLVADSLQHAGAARLKFGGIEENRKLCPTVVGGSTILSMDNQLVDQMIKSGSHVMDDFSDENAPLGITRCFNSNSDYKVPDMGRVCCPRYSLELQRGFVRATVDELSEFSIEDVDLLVGPLQFKPDAVK
jgi:hypothetical protein